MKFIYVMKEPVELQPLTGADGYGRFTTSVVDGTTGPEADAAMRLRTRLLDELGMTELEIDQWQDEFGVEKETSLETLREYIVLKGTPNFVATFVKKTKAKPVIQSRDSFYRDDESLGQF